MRYESYPTLCAEQANTATTTDKDVMEQCMSAEHYYTSLLSVFTTVQLMKPVDEDIQ